jgi:hypothetical protein
MLGQGLWTTVIGMAIGIAGSSLVQNAAFAAIRSERSRSVTLRSALLLTSCVLVACWIPARAIRVDTWSHCADEFELLA